MRRVRLLPRGPISVMRDAAWGARRRRMRRRVARAATLGAALVARTAIKRAVKAARAG